MARDIAAIARYVGGEVIPGRTDAGMIVEGVVDADRYADAGHPLFATLVVGPAARLIAALDACESFETLADVVLICHGDSPGLRVAIARAGCTAIIGAEPGDDLLHSLIAQVLATDQAAEDRAVMTAMRVLTLAARRGGAPGVVAELGHRIDGWVVLLDRHDQVITTAAAGALHVHDAIAVALGRPVRIRNHALQVHPVGPGEDVTARLVIAPRKHGAGRARELGSQTAALLDLVLRTHDTSRTERLGRSLMIDSLLDGGPVASRLLPQWGVHDSTLTAFALASRTASLDIERLLTHWLNDLGATHLFAQRRGAMTGFLRDDHAEQVAERVRTFTSVLFLGLGAPAAVDVLDRSAGEATQALAVARSGGRRVVRYENLSTIRYVFDQLDATAHRRIANLLDPLRVDGSHGELTETLSVFLAENGGWGVAAARLGIHRQTLSNRIHRIERATGLSMSDADDRATAWLAIRALAASSPFRT